MAKKGSPPQINKGWQSLDMEGVEFFKMDNASKGREKFLYKRKDKSINLLSPFLWSKCFVACHLMKYCSVVSRVHFFLFVCFSLCPISGLEGRTHLHNHCNLCTWLLREFPNIKQSILFLHSQTYRFNMPCEVWYLLILYTRN